jgi:tetratricopeptide (TPR) repeat protein
VSELTPEKQSSSADPKGSLGFEPDSNPRSLSKVICLILAAFTLFVFWPVVHFDFVNFDDPDYVTNPHVTKGLTLGGIVWAFGTWHPITWISHMLDAQLFGKDPAGPHFVNLLLHAANSVLLFLVLRRFTKALWPSAFLAALFALHPVQVESVAWVAERKGVLSMFFGLLCLWAYAEYVSRVEGREREKSGIRSSKAEINPKSEVETAKHAEYTEKRILADMFRTRESRFFYILALVFFALGLLSKPMLVTLPFLLLLLDFWPLRRFEPATCDFQPVTPALQNSTSPTLRLIFEKLPFVALALGSCILTLITQGKAGAFQPLEHYSASSRFENALMSYIHYLSKMFWPVDLATPYPRVFHWPVGALALAALVLIGLFVAAFWSRRKWPFILVGWLWFAGTLIPVNGVIQTVAQAVADRYMYLPSIGLFILVTWAVCAAVARGWIPKTFCGVVGGILLLVCAARTRDQLAVWQNSETLFKHALAVTKNNVIAQYNLGMYYQERGRPEEALACYRKTLQMKPDHADALNNIGYVLIGQKKYNEGIQYFEAALRADPNSVEARNNIGYALCMAGRTDEGIAQYRLGLKSKPDHVGVLNNLGNAYAQKRQFNEAIPYYEKSLEINPEQPVAQYGLAHALDIIGDRDKAIEHYRLAVQESPNYAEPRYDFALALARKGDLNEAINQFHEAVRLKPANPSFLFGLGKALAMSQKFDQAIVAYKTGLRIAPTNAEAQSGIGSALATIGKLDEAIPHFKESARLRPENPFTHYFLAKALAAEGKFDQAAPQYAEALRLKPDFGEAKQELDAIRNRARSP